MFLIETQLQRKKERDARVRDREQLILHPLVPSPNDHHTEIWDNLKPGAYSFFLHDVGAKALETPLLLSQEVNRSWIRSRAARIQISASVECHCYSWR